MGPSSQGTSPVYQTFMTLFPLFSNDQCCGAILESGATLVKLLISKDQEAKVCVSPSKLLVPDIPMTADTRVRYLILPSNASLYCAFTKAKLDLIGMCVQEQYKTVPLIYLV